MSESSSVTASDALSRLRGYYPSLSPSEKKTADFILENFESVIRMTLAEVAQQSGVSDATAVRFCRSLGYRGFLDFKIALTLAIPSSPRLIHDDIEEDDDPHTIACKVLRGCSRALEDTLAVLDGEAFERALTLLVEAECILVVGVGTSGPMAHELFNRLFRLRLNCQVQTDSYLQVMQAALLTERDVLVVISQTGDSNDPMRTATVAHTHRCPVICITGNALSPLSELADVILLSVSHETRPETIASRVAQHALIQALYVGLAMQSVEAANEAERTIWDALMRRPPFQAS